MTNLSKFTTLLHAILLSPLAMAETAADGRWHPGIGDPGMTGWMTVGAYLVAAILAGANARTARHLALNAQFWIGCTLLLAFMGINKQLDLQTWLTEIGRDLAKSGGWYENRRPVQVVFILSICSMAVGALVLIRRRLTAGWQAHKVVYLGVALLMLFIIIRAATFHHIDRLLQLGFAGFRFNALLELSAITVVAVGCLQWRMRYQTR